MGSVRQGVSTHNGVRFEIRRTVPASLEASEALSLELRAALGGWCSRSDIFGSELLCREALTNAVLHGSSLDSGRNVTFVARAKFVARVQEARLILSITDEGQGFDWRTAASHTPLECDICGRGMAIYKNYADQIHFNRKGNQLTLLRRLGNGDPGSRGKQL